MTEEPLLTFEAKGPVTLGRIRAASVLDAMNVTRFGAELLAFVQQHPGVHLLLDFEEVDYLSSAVLTELLRINKAVETSGGDFRLCSLNKDIMKVFEITNLDQLFVIYGDAKDAVKKFQRSLQIEAEDDAWGELNDE
jgi:anti-sigma B factor antagonist